MLYNIYYRFKTALASNPLLYVFAIKFLLFRDNFNFPNKNTNLFIFAYPRSGNDYAKQLAKNYNNKLSISSHYHRPSMLLYAIKLKIPTIVIFRNPLDSVSSSMIKYKSELNLVNFPIYPLNDYIACHQVILDNINSFSLIHFDDLIENPNNFFLKLNNELEIMRNNNADNNSKILERVKNKLFDEELEFNNIIAETKGPSEKKEELKNEAKQMILNNYQYTLANKLYHQILNHIN